MIGMADHQVLNDVEADIGPRIHEGTIFCPASTVLMCEIKILKPEDQALWKAGGSGLKCTNSLIHYCLEILPSAVRISLLP